MALIRYLSAFKNIYVYLYAIYTNYTIKNFKTSLEC